MRLFIGSLLLMLYVVTLSYKGSLLSILTVTPFSKPMDTIEEIANQVIFNPKPCGGGGSKMTHWSGDRLPFLTGSCYGGTMLRSQKFLTLWINISSRRY